MESWRRFATACDLKEEGALRAKRLGQVFTRFDRAALVSAHEYVYGGKSIFWPRMNGDMGFGDQNDAGHPLRFKRMEFFTDDPHFGHAGSLQDRFLDEFRGIQAFRTATEKVED